MYTSIRWRQRFQNFEKAFLRLKNAIERFQKTPEDELILEGLVQTYEFTYELGVNVVRDFLEEEGDVEMLGARSVIKKAVKRGIVQDAYLWMEAISDRNKTSHTYNEAIAQEVVKKICESYAALLEELYHYFNQKYHERDAE